METSIARSMRCRTAVTLVLSSALCAPAFADTTKEQELEARVQQLEKLVKDLMAKQPASTPAAGAPSTSPPAAAVAATPAPSTPAIQATSITPNAVANTRFTFSGFVKLDAMWSKYKDGEIADGSVGRDFYLPGTIPLDGESEDADFDAHIKQSRFIFGTDTDIAPGKVLSSRLEVDLYGSSLGDERATNTYGVQVRHAYLSYGHWLVGQTWSNFQDAAALPETADFIGPTDGTIFVRQPMVRYTAGNFSIAAENPETTITPFGGGTRISSDDNNVPDITAAYTFKFGTHYIRAAALARQLKYETTGPTGASDTTYGGALSLSGKFMLGKDDVRFMVTGGEGFGRYVGVNFNNDVVLEADRDLKTISGWAAFAAYRHVWNTQLRSTLMGSASDYDNDTDLTGAGANKSSWSIAINTFFSPVPKLDVGVELRHAVREIESGSKGSMNRLQGTAKYSF